MPYFSSFIEKLGPNNLEYIDQFIIHEKASHSGDHLCQIGKESIKSNRLYRADPLDYELTNERAGVQAESNISLT